MLCKSTVRPISRFGPRFQSAALSSRIGAGCGLKPCRCSISSPSPSCYFIWTLALARDFPSEVRCQVAKLWWLQANARHSNMPRRQLVEARSSRHSACPQCSCALVWLLGPWPSNGWRLGAAATTAGSCDQPCGAAAARLHWVPALPLFLEDKGTLACVHSPNPPPLSSKRPLATWRANFCWNVKSHKYVKCSSQCCPFKPICVHWTGQQTSVLLLTIVLCPPEKWDKNSGTKFVNLGESYRGLGQSLHTSQRNTHWLILEKSADRLLKEFYY